MTYDEVLAKINTYVKFGSKLGLERMQKLMQLLGDPQEHLKIIHVAGTNGKGSVCRYVYDILLANGYRAGLYTSPFLERFTERMEVDGEEITSDELSACTEIVIQKAQELVGLGFESPTEFEIITAIGFVFFQRQNVEYLVLEVGLGGRGDATNIISSPLVCVITSIAYDHTEYLGDTLAKIAGEKAGIIKSGVPVIAQVEGQEVADVIRQVCREQDATFYDVTGFRVQNLVQRIDGYEFGLYVSAESEKGQTLKLDYPDVAIAMIGRHQMTNAVTALAVIKVLEEYHHLVLHPSETLRGLRCAVQRGRFEVLRQRPYVIIDVAHNEAGVRALRTVMEEHFKGKKVLTVTGLFQDKATDGLFQEMADFTDDFIATMSDSPRSLDAAELSQKLAHTGKPCVCIPDWKEAVQVALERRYEYHVILFTGSLYLIGAVRSEIQKDKSGIRIRG